MGAHPEIMISRVKIREGKMDLEFRIICLFVNFICIIQNNFKRGEEDLIDGRKKGFLMILLALLPVVMALGQSPVDKLSREAQRDYRNIRSHVRNTPKSIETDVDALASYLEEGMNSDLEKVRSLYLWVAYNVTYDMKAFMRGRLGEQSVPDVLQKRKAVCEGYANLFSALCERAGIENRKIIGYSKGYGYEAGQKFAVSNHAWNAVRLDEEWASK